MSELVTEADTSRAPLDAPKILFVAHTGDVSGPTHSLLHLIRRLGSHYRVGVVAPARGFLSDSLPPLDADFIALPDFSKRSIPAFYRIVTSRGYDLVYGNTASSGPRNALIAAKLARRPFVWHFRSIEDDWTWKQGLFVRWANRVIAVSSACAEPLRRFRPHRDVVVAYNGIDPMDFTQNRGAFTVELRAETPGWRHGRTDCLACDAAQGNPVRSRGC